MFSEKVSIVKTDEKNLYAAVKQAIDLIGGFKNIRGKRNITIKPNLCALKSSSSGATVNPRVIDALVSKINSINSCQINIVETNNSQASAGKTFEYLGYKYLEEKYENVKCVNLSREPKINVQINGEIFLSLKVPELMIFSDYLISVAKLKTHIDFLYTGVMKNLYGFLLGPRVKYHPFMSKVLVDLNKFYSPDLCMIDGIIGMEGFGPTGGTPKKVGVIVAGRNPVATDIVGSQIIGINPSKIKYINYAKKKGLLKSKEVQIVGSDFDEVKTNLEIIKSKGTYLGRTSLFAQKLALYWDNLATFLRLSRSASTTIGFSTLKNRMSYWDMFQLVRETIFKVED